jgi:hypothetical protein
MDQLFSLNPDEHMNLLGKALSLITGPLNINASQVAGSLIMLGVAVGVCFILFRLLLLIFKLGLLVGALYFLTFFIGTNETDATSIAIPLSTRSQNTVMNNQGYAQVSSTYSTALKSGHQQISVSNLSFLKEPSRINSFSSWDIVSDKITDTIHLLKEYEFSLKKKG